MSLELRETQDGSHTLYITELDEHYHSYHGAIQEALHVFINNGLNPLLNAKQLNILEVGWGTGLNSLLTCHYANSTLVRYIGIEPFPIEKECSSKLNYESRLLGVQKGLYNQIIDAPWEVETFISPNFSIHKIKNFIQTWDTKLTFDLVYYDAFGPRAQAEMWERDTLEKVISKMHAGSILVTYCAKGQLKRDLVTLNCRVETLPGPPGKREMIRAIKN
ncbi:MAG: tRNA (5-methylaminomethyl-2-thiouridine)(34)-methyltransferase MnmD [Bacteroidota bacterium]|jgi:tRNA U34 5-methylaminomethyl-2-thiouridine-forming methyltransferase MnmC